MPQIANRSKKKKLGRPSKADLSHRSTATETEVRRSLRRRNVRCNIDIDDYEFDDDDYFYEDDDERRRRQKRLKLVLGETFDEAREPHAQGDVEDEEGEEHGDCGEEENEEKVDIKEPESDPGTPVGVTMSVHPLPDKKTLELILSKFQKKDKYGVYAEPVDPEELPDYFDIIEHPMDFATVRKKLANGDYATLEEFESDIFLICSNAMQYNTPETIYYKQARSIRELAERKFQKLKIGIERSEKVVKSEQGTKFNSLVKNQNKKPLGRTSREPIGSDFSSGATLANAGDIQKGCDADQPSCERLSNNDEHMDANILLKDTNMDKIEELSSGNVIASKLGRRLSNTDENRRETYNTSYKPVVGSESTFTTFEGEVNQLVAVGLHAEYFYARSLARFAANLGPLAWKTASRRIAEAIPAGCKFGRGWVGEYEPPPSPLFVLDNFSGRSCPLVKTLQCGDALTMDDSVLRKQLPTQEDPVNTPSLGGMQHSGSSETNVSTSGEMVSRNLSLQSTVPFNHQDRNGGSAVGGLPDGNITRSNQSDGNLSPYGRVYCQMGKPESSSSNNQHQGLSDPVQQMSSVVTDARQQQYSSDRFSANNPPAVRTLQSNSASAAEASAWMSVGAGRFKQAPMSNVSKNQTSTNSNYNLNRELNLQNSEGRGHFSVSGEIQIESEKNGLHGPPGQNGIIPQFKDGQNSFPQVKATNWSAYQMQSSWQGRSPQNQTKQKQGTFPPDLNIGFQSPGSPAKRSSNIMVDSQQPDLALQL